MARLADYAPPPDQYDTVRLENLEGTEVTVLAARFRDGTWGKYAFIDVKMPDGRVVSLITGAAHVLEAVKKASEAQAFPLQAKFVKRGRRWIVI